MKTLVRKELQENLRLAALGLVIFGLIQVLSYIDYSEVMKSLALSHGVRGGGGLMQPLLEKFIVMGTAFFCGLFGALLGWLQIHNERRPDLWAFLMHRPLSATQIFLCKAAAGLTLYALVAGLPLACSIIWAVTPGHVAAPFEWRMLEPVAAFFLSGVVYYFAGMLTGLRQARWYGSRAFGVGVAIIVSTAMVSRPHFGKALLVIFIGGTILAAAVWSAFQSHGFAGGQPRLGKAALTLSLAMGSLVVVFFSAAVLFNLLPRIEQANSWSNYVIASDGTIYKVTQGTDRSPEMVDLEGQPLKDAKTGRQIDWAEFRKHLQAKTSFAADIGWDARNREWIQRSYQLFSFWRTTPDTLWSYWARCGRLVAYDLQTRRLIGSLGPVGFARDLYGNGDRFADPAGSSRTFRTTTNICQVDLENRTVKTLFTTMPDDPILANSDVIPNGYDWDSIVVVTRQFIRLLTPEGKEVWKAPYDPAYKSVAISFLEPSGRFALWLAPSHSPYAKGEPTLPTQVTWIARDQGALRTATLPPLPVRASGPGLDIKLLSAVMPPLVVLMAPWLENQPQPQEEMQRSMPLVLTSLAVAALLCVPLGWWFGTRHRLSLKTRLAWAAFHLIGGVPGLLAYICEEEWPAREPCPNCQKLRVVNRRQCEHCGAPFAPPVKTGLEIFQPLATQSEER